MQRYPMTVWQTPRTQASFHTAAIKITCAEVTDCSDKIKFVIVIALPKVEEEFNPVKEFPNLFSKTIPTKLLPLRNVNHHIDPKPGSEWLPAWRPSAPKVGQHINDKLNAEIK